MIARKLFYLKYFSGCKELETRKKQNMQIDIALASYDPNRSKYDLFSFHEIRKQHLSFQKLGIVTKAARILPKG